jgi:CBS domain-containing protein
MFSVYGKAGRVFRGSLEELRRVGAATGLTRTRSVGAVGQEGRDHGSDSGFAGLMAEASGGGAAPPIDVAHRAALAAYAEVRKADTPRQPLTKVQTIMSIEVVLVPDSMTIEDAWLLLEQRGMGQAPVVSEQQVLVGLLARAGLMRTEHLPKAESHPLVWRAWLAQSVAEVMWSPVPSVALDTDIRRVARVLLDTGLPGLPVADEEGRVTGFVSRSDILRAVVADPPLDLWT